MKIQNLMYLASLSLPLFVSCSDLKESHEDIQLEIVERFDFAVMSSRSVEMSVGRRALVNIYDTNPDNDTNPQPVYAAFTDDTGHYSGMMQLPADKVSATLYSEVNGHVYTMQKNASGFEIALTAEQSAPEETIEAMCYRLSDEYRTLLNESNPKNFSKLQNSGNVNVKIKEDETTLTAAFVFSGASAGSKLYYYYYPSDVVPEVYFGALAGKENKEIWEYIRDRFAVPEYQLFKDFGNHGSIWSAWMDKQHKDYSVGRSSELLFYGENYDTPASAKFKAGFTVAFFQILQGEKSANSYRSLKRRPMFSESWLNTYADSDFSDGYFDPDLEGAKSIETFYTSQHMDNGRDSHVINGGHVQAGMFAGSQQKAVVVGFEDLADLWIDCDHDYNDNIFAVIMEPKQIDDIPKLEETDDKGGSEYAVGTLLYEDLFPSEGDYDMNDVVIRYTWIKHFDKDNNLTAVEYRFVPISVSSNALYVSDFYLMIDDPSTGRIIKPAGSPVFSNHKESYNKRFTGTYQLSDRGMKKDDVTWDMFNPFIHVTTTGHEVHLAKKRFGGIGSLSAYQELDTRQQNYLTPARKAQYSFALNIPTSYFEIVTEGVRIDVEYPLYLTWFVSEGREAADWYLPVNHRPVGAQ